MLRQGTAALRSLQHIDCGRRCLAHEMPSTVKSQIKNQKSQCVFCHRSVPTRGHHVVPRCKGGTEIVPTCHSCEDFIHETWSHNELRDVFNTVESILADARFQKFLKWLHKQQDSAVFRSQRGRTRRPGKYRR